MAARRRSAFSLRLRYFRTPAASSMMRRRSSGRALSTASIWPWLMMTCCWRPTPVSDSSSWMSSSRHGTPLMAYSLSPVRNSVRVMVTSVNSIGRSPAQLSMVRLTSARPSAGRLAVPAKMTSSIFWQRTARRAPGRRAPSRWRRRRWTCRCRSGPTTTVTPGSRSRAVVSAKDLKPFSVSVLRNIRATTLVPARGARRTLGGRTPSAQTWQASQKKTGLLPKRALAMGARQRRQASPSRSYTLSSSW